MMGALALFACAIEAQTPVPGRSAIPAPRALGQRRPLIGGRNPQPGAEQQGGGDSKVPMAPNTVKHFGDQLPDDTKTTMPALKFEQADAQFLMEAYAAEVGRTLLIAPDLPKVTGITLRSSRGVPLTREEYLEAIEISLAMNGISLEQFGDKFIKALPSKSIRTSGIKIMMEKPEGGHPEQGRTVSQMIQLKSITISEAQKALEGFKRPDGLIQAFERTNSLLVTDTQENVNRMLEIVRFIDQPMIATEEVNVRSIVHAKAADIKKVLEEIVTESQKQTQSKEEVKQNTSGSPGFTRTTPTPQPVSSVLNRTVPGIRRPGAPDQPATPASTPNANIEALMSDADRGMIRGKVQIIADERSNQLIIITRKENMDFFDKIITVLDIETAPDVKATVRRLEFADAKDVAPMLNDLIGNASTRSNDNSNRNSTSGTNANANREQPGGGHHTGVGGVPKSTSLNDAAKARSSGTRTTGSDTGAAGLGQITKDDIKILADERTNAIVMMGTPSAIAAILELIDRMDIQLSQVLIETVVIQVLLGDELTTGIDWIKMGKRGGVVGEKQQTVTAEDGTESTKTVPVYGTIRDTLFRNGDQMGGGGGAHASMLESLVGAGTNTASTLAGTGLNYFLKSDKLQISALIEAAKSDNRTKVLSSPILMTVDNKEATIEATDMRYLYKGVRYSGSSYNGTEVPDYEQRDIGLTVKVTPRISPNGMVVLTIEETFETIGANQQVGAEAYPTVTTRKLSAEVSVENMQTVVLGGLVQNEIKKSESGIPILKDIPVIGKYLFASTTSADTRSELLVFMTPYVFNDSKSLTDEALRRKQTLSDPRPWIDYGWSASSIADPMSKDEKMHRIKEKWREQDRDYNANKTYEKLMKAREEQLRRRSELDAHNAWKELEREDRKYAPASSDTSWVRDIRTSDSVQVIKPAEKPSAPKKEDAVPVEPIL